MKQTEKDDQVFDEHAHLNRSFQSYFQRTSTDAQKDPLPLAYNRQVSTQHG